MKQLQNLNYTGKRILSKLCKLKNVTALNISTSASLQMNAELTYACDPVEHYPLLNTDSTQPSLSHPIDPSTFFPSI